MKGSASCLLCAPIVAATVPALTAAVAEAAAAGAQIVELRIDFLPVGGFEVAELLAAAASHNLPAIITYRPEWEGGQYSGDEEHRLDTLRQAIKLGADYVDIELKVAKEFMSDFRNAKHKTKFIVSHHNYTGVPSDAELLQLVQDMIDAGCDIAKVVGTAQDVTDNDRILRLLMTAKVPMIALAMGPKGQISRLLAPKYGAYLTFGALSAGQESAPGQTTIQELVNVYKLGRHKANTKVFGLIGNPVSHSRGPQLHNAAFAHVGVEAVYVPFLVDSIERFLATFTSSDFAGFSVTIPHKEAAMRCCDEVDPVAKAIGAVNTLVRKADGTLFGYNTDYSAAISAIEDGLRSRDLVGSAQGSPLQDKVVVVVGAGGAGRAVAFGAAQKGARVLIANRRAERAEELAQAVGCESIPWTKLTEGAQGDVLANTTSLGMHPNEDQTPVPQNALRGYSIVFDAVYNPLETRLLREAKACGAVAVSGVEMFVGQAADQFQLFTGKPAPRELMKQTVVDSL
eukprot:jgi/Chlat1/5527/Chrsp369S05341